MTSASSERGRSKTKHSRAMGWLLVLLALLVGAVLLLFNLPTQHQVREHAREAAGEASRRLFRQPEHRRPIYQVDQPDSDATVRR